MAKGAAGKRGSYEDEQRALTEAMVDARSDGARIALSVALRSKRSLVVARAARMIKEHQLEHFEGELQEAFDRFFHDPIKSDPSCHAKLAALEALDYAESGDAAPFLRAVRHVQLEGPDTAVPLRARGILGLARLGHPDLELWVAELAGDAAPPVRQAAFEALAHRGDRNGAGIALYKLNAGDEDPLVTLAAMNALLALAPEWGRAELGAALDGKDEQRRELAAVALGQSRDDTALTLLLAALERCTRSTEREPLLHGVGLHRSDRALAALATVIEERGVGDATAAIVALGARRFEPGVAARVRAAAMASEQRAELLATVDESFPPQK